MDLLLPVAKITPDTGMPQCIRLSQEAMNSLDVREHDPVLVIHAQHSTQAGAIVGSPLLSSANYVILDVVTRYALGAIGGHQVRVVKGNLEPGTSVVVTPRRRWKMPVEEADFRHILQDRIVAPRQRIPLIIHGIWLDFEVVSILPESQMVRVTPDTRIVVKPLVEKLAASNLVHNAELPRGTGDGPGEVQPPAAEPADPILDATDLNPEFNALPPELRPPLEVGEPSIPSDPPFEIPPATKEYYQTTWGFDPTAVLKPGQGGSPR